MYASSATAAAALSAPTARFLFARMGDMLTGDMGCNTHALEPLQADAALGDHVCITVPTGTPQAKFALLLSASDYLVPTPFCSSARVERQFAQSLS